MSKVLIGFSPNAAFGMVEQFAKAEGIKLPYQVIREVMIYLVSNLDMNMALTSVFWEPTAIKKFAHDTGTLPGLSGLDSKQLNLVMNLLKPLGLELYSIVYQRKLFKPTNRDTFPYIVKLLDASMVVLEEDN